ncbi:MAG: hypothetical protein ACFB00_09610 [Parvularculaceae bacterium]
MRIIPASVHGVLDYLVAVSLIAGPFVLGFEGVAKLLAVAGGVGLIAYSLITDYSTSARRLIPFRTHLLFDFLAAVVLVIAPFAFGFATLATYFYVAIGAAVILVVLVTNPETGEAAA